MPPTVCEESSVGAGTFDKAASCWMMNLGQGDRQLIFRYLNSIILREIVFSLGILTCGDPWCFAYDNFEPCTRPAWDEIVPFTLDTQSVEGAPSCQHDSEMSRVAAIARKYGGK
jgi:hypothetical protein